MAFADTARQATVRGGSGEVEGHSHDGAPQLQVPASSAETEQDEAEPADSAGQRSLSRLRRTRLSVRCRFWLPRHAILSQPWSRLLPLPHVSASLRLLPIQPIQRPRPNPGIVSGEVPWTARAEVHTCRSSSAHPGCLARRKWKGKLPVWGKAKSHQCLFFIRLLLPLQAVPNAGLLLASSRRSHGDGQRHVRHVHAEDPRWTAAACHWNILPSSSHLAGPTSSRHDHSESLICP